jgi:hypothetical protein
VADDEQGTAAIQATGEIVRRDARWAIARAVVPLDRLQPGGYLARAQISGVAATSVLVSRPFTFLP